MLEFGELILEAARRRPESRGTHLFFESEGNVLAAPTDENWEKYIVVKKGDDEKPVCEVRETGGMEGG